MKTIRQTILATANYYRMQISEDVLEMYAEDLADLDPEACIDAYVQWRRNPKNKTFPLPAQIREMVEPEKYITAEVEAREIAARILGAITKYGWNNSREAQVFIGPVGWNAVNTSGGWQYLCENMGVTLQPGTFQAQIRDRLEGMILYGNDTLDRKIHAIEKREARKELSSISEIMKVIPGKNPDGAA